MPAVLKHQRVVYLLVGLFIGALATGMVWATNGGDSEVRVAARVLDDGRVEVGIQQRAAGSEWGELERPEHSVVPADVERGRWLYSSALSITSAAVTGAFGDTTTVEESQADREAPLGTDPEAEAEDATTSTTSISSIGPFEIIGTPTSSRPFDEETLFCVITHGNQDDFFWYQVYSAFVDAQVWNGINLRAEMYELGADQAAGITQCVSDGAAAIATTLADPGALAPALAQATEAGARLLTFNSGADRATEVGAAGHVSLDEAAVGRIAAEQFLARDVSGDVICIIHEPTNQGLELRCDSLEATYDAGDVHRLRLTESDDDPVSTIAAAVTQHENIGGAIALNANTAYNMADALSQEHPDITLAAVSADFPRPLAMLHAERLDFVLWSHALEQGYHAITALLFAHGTPLSPDTGIFGEATQITIQPSVLTASNVQRLLEQGNVFGETLPAWLHGLQQAIESETGSPESE